MPTNEQNLAHIRRRLGQPLPNGPDDQTLLTLLVDQLMHHSAQLVNTRNHWAIEKWTLTVSSGLEDYIISAQNFGRPFLIYTTNDADTYHVRREVPFSLMQDADRRYSGPQQATTSDGSGHSAAEFVFYRKEGQGWFARPVPIPASTGTYEVWYETNYGYGSLGDTPGLEAFHHLVRVQTAIAALPFCRWHHLAPNEDAKAWNIQVGAIRDALLHDEMKFQKAFNDYKAQASREGVSGKIGYAQDYEYSPFGVGTMTNGYGI